MTHVVAILIQVQGEPHPMDVERLREEAQHQAGLIFPSYRTPFATVLKARLPEVIARLLPMEKK